MTVSFDILHELWAGLQSGHLPPVGLWGYLLLALLVMVEGPIATLLGAAAAAGGMMRPSLVFLSAATGNLAADSLWYALGYAGRTEWLIERMGWLGLRRDQIERLEGRMRRSAVPILMVAKLTAGLVIPALMAAGMARVPMRRWLGTLFALECLWTGALVLAGIYLTESIAQIEQGIHLLAISVAVVALLFGAFWLLGRRLRAQVGWLDAEAERP